MLCFQGRRVGHGRDQAIDASRKHRLVHQHVGAPGERDQLVRRRRVAGDDDGPIGGVEPVAERRHDRRMAHQCGGHLDVLVLEHEARRGQLVDVNQRRQRIRPSSAMRVSMSAAFISKNRRVIFSSGGGPQVSTRVAQPRRPREPHQVAVVGRVIRVLVGQEDMAEGRQRNAGERELPRDSVAAVDHVGRAVDQDDLRRG